MAAPAETLLTSPDFAEFLFNNLSSAVFIVDGNFRVRKVNDVYRSLFSKSEKEVLNQLCGNTLGCAFAIEQQRPCGSTSACGECTIRSCIANSLATPGDIQNTYVSRTFYINGLPVEKRFRIKARLVEFGGEELAIVAVDDVTELEEERRKVQEMANRDYLTGLYNRRYFFEVGESFFQNAKRGSLRLAVAMIDIDHFKRINDTYGHAAGDAVLKGLARILERNLRKADVLSRFGGEEFCVLLNCKDGEDAYAVLDKIRLLVEREEFDADGRRVSATISAGITNRLGESLEKMINQADEMLYKAKNSGRNRCEVYT